MLLRAGGGGRVQLPGQSYSSSTVQGSKPGALTPRAAGRRSLSPGALNGCYIRDQPQAQYDLKNKEKGSQTVRAVFLTHLLKFLEDTRFLH